MRTALVIFYKRGRATEYSISERIRACVRIGLVLGIMRVYADITEHLLDPFLAPSPRDRSWRQGSRAERRSAAERSVDAPGAFVVQDVCAGLADLFWRSCIVR